MITIETQDKSSAGKKHEFSDPLFCTPKKRSALSHSHSQNTSKYHLECQDLKQLTLLGSWSPGNRLRFPFRTGKNQQSGLGLMDECFKKKKQSLCQMPWLLSVENNSWEALCFLRVFLPMFPFILACGFLCFSYVSFLVNRGFHDYVGFLELKCNVLRRISGTQIGGFQTQFLWSNCWWFRNPIF